MTETASRAPKQVHASCVAVTTDDGLVGVLLRGQSGVGKSDLALRLIDNEGRGGGALLVADDRVDLIVRDGEIRAVAPAALAGLLEVRGLGIMPLAHLADVAIELVVDLVAEGADIPRLPDVRHTDLLGMSLPWMQLQPFEAAAAAKLRLAVRALPWNDMQTLPPNESQP